ncbi:hypothetical protein JCM15548_12639 [Geofilum rubicundum JCM 15548]|uniref:Uncharacterized protein n=1 Tax=Geofilum rubicundum JCM 15548 TaxID=1236989 RepID=A0A0E9LYR1_9BACT|nr:hypothetical protein JCM15548_12639 [Geofilum rubicundum JCM 15548]
MPTSLINQEMGPSLLKQGVTIFCCEICDNVKGNSPALIKFEALNHKYISIDNQT